MTDLRSRMHIYDHTPAPHFWSEVESRASAAAAARLVDQEIHRSAVSTRPALVVLAALLGILVISAAIVVGSGVVELPWFEESPMPSPSQSGSQEGDSRCLPASAALVAAIETRMPDKPEMGAPIPGLSLAGASIVESGDSFGDFYAVEYGDLEEMYFVGGQVVGGSLEDVAAVFVTDDPNGGGSIFTVNGPADGFSEWPDRPRLQPAAGFAEANACAQLYVGPQLPLRNNGAIVVVDPTRNVLTAFSPADIVAPSLPSEAIVGLTAAAFSPDGNELAYSDAIGVHLLDIATSERRQIAECPRCSIAWDPSGTRRLVLQGIANSDGLVVLELESGESIGIPGTTEAAFPTWSPDGRRLLFEETRRSLVTIRTDGTDRTVVAGPNSGRFWSPAWSPDGRTIAYLSFAILERSFGHSHWQLSLMTMTPEGGSPRLLAELGECSGDPETPDCAFSELEPAGLSWSPDGSRLAMNAPRPQSWNEFRVIVIGADGSGLELLAGAGSGRPAWQPVP